MNYSETRRRFAEVLDMVVNDCEDVVVTRAGREPAVIVSLREYESLKETDYLLRSPQNARLLREAKERLESGGGEEHRLVELG